MTATLSVRRDGFGIELRRGPFEIVLDDRSVGSVERQQSTEVPVAPGRHTLRIRTGRYGSRPHTFEVDDGETVNFRCYGANLWPVYVASILKPDLGISLKRE